MIAAKLLVNNAGFGTYGPFADSDAERELELVAVNVAALFALTRALRQAVYGGRRGRRRNRYGSGRERRR